MILAVQGLGTTAAFAESRVALVIGNGKYVRDPLPNPARDARLIADTLRRVGFDVIEAVDANRQAMQQALVAFSRRLNEKATVGLFYYAGHGVQVNGENYLLPIDVDIRTEAEVLLQGVNLNEVLVTLRPENNRLAVAILDACRNNPFVGLARGLRRGLAPVTAPAGTLIAFSTAPGEVALDGAGQHSPYTAALAAAIPAPGLTLEEVFKRTRQRVMQQTRDAQVPWEHSSLTGRFFFVPKTTVRLDDRDAVAGSIAAIRLAEVNAWERIKHETTTLPYEDFLKQFPDGDFAELAQHRIKRFAKSPNSWTWWLPKVAALRQPGDAPPSTAEELYERGLRLEAEAKTPEDLRHAKALYKAAADAGLEPAMFRLARLIERQARSSFKSGGTRLAFDAELKSAAKWYAGAAQKSHPAAQRALGTLHEFGEGVRQDLAEALRLYKISAEAGDAGGMTSLGFLYATGKGVGRDPKTARDWYARAAAKGSERAMFNLAIMLMGGEGGRVNIPEASKWLKEAAKRGHPGAMRQLAALYDQGRGLPRDSDSAANFLLKAFAGGDKAASSDLYKNSRRWSRATRRAIQRVLKEDGHYAGAIHGVFNTSTKRALTSYQRKFAL